MKKIAVIGAGNGGVSMGAYMSLSGARVNIYDKFPEAIREIKEAGGIELSGVSLNGFAKFDVVSSEIKEVIDGCKLIMIVTPAFAHKAMAKECAEHLVDGQIIVLHPGRTGGALEVYNTIKIQRPELDITVSEAQTLIYASRKLPGNKAHIYGVKKKISVASVPNGNNEEAIREINKYYKEFVPSDNVLETSFLNIGAIFHPTPSLLNIARIECKSSFKYYHEGITESVGKILEEIDSERMEIAKAYNIDTISAIQWIEESYGVKEDTIYKAIKGNDVYSGISAPTEANTRYISEDVPMSLTPLAEFGKLANVETPMINRIISMASVIHGKDYYHGGRNLETMGLKGMNVEEIVEFVKR
jgi:opine dehydrogenase